MMQVLGVQDPNINGLHSKSYVQSPFKQICLASRERNRACLCQSTKRTKVFGEWLIETDEPDTLEQPPTSDFWEGPQFEVIGKSAGFAVPLLLVLLLLVGFFAASGYNSGATAVLQPPTSPEDVARIVSTEETS